MRRNNPRPPTGTGLSVTTVSLVPMSGGPGVTGSYTTTVKESPVEPWPFLYVLPGIVSPRDVPSGSPTPLSFFTTPPTFHSSLLVPILSPLVNK